MIGRGLVVSSLVIVLCGVCSATPYRLFYSVSGLAPYSVYYFGYADVFSPNGATGDSVYGDGIPIYTDLNGSAVRMVFCDTDYTQGQNHYLAVWLYDETFEHVGAVDTFNFDFSHPVTLNALLNAYVGYDMTFTVYVEPIDSGSPVAPKFSALVSSWVWLCRELSILVGVLLFRFVSLRSVL